MEAKSRKIITSVAEKLSEEISRLSSVLGIEASKSLATRNEEGCARLHRAMVAVKEARSELFNI